MLDSFPQHYYPVNPPAAIIQSLAVRYLDSEPPFSVTLDTPVLSQYIHIPWPHTSHEPIIVYPLVGHTLLALCVCVCST